MKQLIGQLIAFVSVFFIGTHFVWATVSISPAIVSLDLEQGRPSGKFVISNKSSEEKRYRIQAAHFEYSPQGGLGVIAPDENSLATWIKFNPREFSLPANSKRVIRFAILPRGKLNKKTYWAAMELESLDTMQYGKKDNKGSEYKVKVVPSVLVPIFGTVGNVTYSGVIDELKLDHTEDGLKVMANVVNTGNGKLVLNGEYQVVEQTGKVVVKNKLAPGLLLPEASRQMVSFIPVKEIKAGNYKLRIAYRSPGADDEIVKEVPLVLN